MKTILSLAIAGLMATSVQASNTIFEKNEDAIEYRQAAFQLIRYQLGDMGAMMKGEKPFDQAAFSSRANNIAALATLPWEAFIAGSDSGKTDAAAAVWSNHEEFAKRADSFKQYTQALAQAANSGDEKAIKQAFGPVAKSCKGCHQDFKK